MSEGWKPKRLWPRREREFGVEISVHEAMPLDGEGPWRWCVYAYVRKAHPHFKAFEGDDIFQDAGQSMPFHWGCTYIEWTFDGDGSALCVKAGADYGHLHDGWFTHQDQMPPEVQKDADELYEWLAARGSDEKVKGDA